MKLPIRTTLDDASKVCSYLNTKPTGATVAEAKTVLDSSFLDGRKLTAYRVWGLIEEAEDRMRLTEAGRRFVKKNGAEAQAVMREVVRRIQPYSAIIERAHHAGEDSLTAVDVGAHWHQTFREWAGDSDKVLNDQAVCFFHVAQGAGLGTLVIGRHGQPTRIDLARAEVNAFVAGPFAAMVTATVGAGSAVDEDASLPPHRDIEPPPAAVREQTTRVNRVFITHGKNKKIVEQIKKLVRYGKFEPVVATEHETVSKPVPDKVMEDMRTCSAAIIHVASEEVVTDRDGKERHLLNENVLIEIGAAMALYGRNFILLVQNGIKLPSNLQGLYECRYDGDALDGDATMKLLDALTEIK